jgi:hypothetical protein
MCIVLSPKAYADLTSFSVIKTVGANKYFFAKIHFLYQMHRWGVFMRRIAIESFLIPSQREGCGWLVPLQGGVDLLQSTPTSSFPKEGITLIRRT